MDTIHGRRVLGSTRLLKALSKNRTLSRSAKFCYLLMCGYGRDSGECYASLSTLAGQLLTSRRQVKRWIHQLENAGFIATRHVPGKPAHRVFPWHVDFTAAFTLSGDTDGPTLGTPMAPSGDTGVPRCIGSNREEVTSSKPSMTTATEVRRHVWGYFQGQGKDQVPPPDQQIVERCVRALHGHSVEELEQFLRAQFRQGRERGKPSGPRGYAWFPAVIEQHFRPARSQ